mgnify:CR=1 FL=1
MTGFASHPALPDATAGLLARFAIDTEPESALRALSGLDGRAVRHLLAERLLLSEESAAFLDAVPAMLRMAASEQVNSTRRTHGEVRGQVVWNETLVARAAAGFPADLFVCSIPERSFDLAENRLVKSCLGELGRAERHLAFWGPAAYAGPRRQEAAQRGSLARSLEGHRVLSNVDGSGSANRARVLSQVRRSKKVARYQPALVMAHYDRVALAANLASVLDRRTRYQHEVLDTVLSVVESTGVSTELRVVESELVSSLVCYRHPGRRGEVGASGIRFESLLIDVPDFPGLDANRARRLLGRRAGSLEPVLVGGPRDLPALRERLLAALRTSSDSPRRETVRTETATSVTD